MPTTKARKLSASASAVSLSVAATRGRPLLCLWGSRRSIHCDISDGVNYYDFRTIFDELPRSTRAGVLYAWPESCKILRERLQIPITDKRVSYLSNKRAPTRCNAPRNVLEISDRLTSLEPTVLDQRACGFESVGCGTKRLPDWLDYLSPARRALNRGVVGCIASDRIGENVDHLYSRCVRMRRGGGYRDMVYAFRDAGAWPRDERGRLSPRDMLRGLNLAPEIWIRRRIARRSSVISLSIYGTREVGHGRWEVVDITPLVALHASNVDAGAPVLWRRAVYLVDRGDGMEWVILHPAEDRREFIAATETGSGIRGDAYEGSPARTLISSLSKVWPTPPRARWILDDSPLKDAGEVR